MAETSDHEYSFKDFALSSTTECLDPEHKLNAYMRDNGIGQMPNVAGLDIENLSATFACDAIQCYITVPLGWFIFDDGRRVLVYDEDSQVQVNFELGSSEGLTDVDIIEQVIVQHVNNVEGAEWRTMELAGMKTLAIRGIPMQGEYVDQVYIIKATPDPNTWLIVRTTCLPSATIETMNMVEVMLDAIRYVNR